MIRVREIQALGRQIAPLVRESPTSRSCVVMYYYYNSVEMYY